MKVLLVRPNADAPSNFPPLGLLHIASYLRENGRYSIHIVDAANTFETPEQIGGIASDFEADVVGISSLAADSKHAAMTAEAVRAKRPGATIVMGGAHVTSSPIYFLKFPAVDYCISGEGEIAFHNLLDLLSRGGNGELSSIPGVYYKTADGETTGTPRSFIPDLDAIPPPAWDLIDVESYFRNKHRRPSANPHFATKRCLPVMTARGCPFGCSYCHDVAGRKVRAYSKERVLSDIEYLEKKLGATEVEIIDDLFNYNLKRATSVLDTITERGLKVPITLTNGLRADYISDDFLESCKRAGVYRIIFAIESGSPRVQKAMHKRVNLERAQENISKAAAMRFSTGGYFMLGFPDETYEEMQMSIKFAVDSDLHTAGFSIVATFPNTELYEWAISKGFSISGEYEDYNKVSTNLSKVPSQTIMKLRRDAFRRFYFNPKRIYRFFRDTPVKMFWRKAYIAARQFIIGDVDSGKKKFW